MSFTYVLETPDHTARLGKMLAQAALCINPGAVLLYGSLGAGKTTLTRHFVENLPGGNEAEVSSPSFTTCNIYSTKPEVHHYDLYRLEQTMPEESLTESLDTPSTLTIIEWAERLPLDALPQDGVICRIDFTGEVSNTLAPSLSQTRNLEFFSLGPRGESFLGVVVSLF